MKKPRAIIEAVSPEEYRQGLEKIGATTHEFARFAGVSRRTGFRWADFGLLVPGSTLLQLMIALGLTLDEAQEVMDASGLKKKVRKIATGEVGQVVYLGIPSGAPGKNKGPRNGHGPGKRKASAGGSSHEIAGS